MTKLLGAQLLQQWREALKTMPPGLTQAAKILLGKEITSNKVLLTVVLAMVLLLVARVYFGTRKKLPPGIHKFLVETLSTAVLSRSGLRLLFNTFISESWSAMFGNIKFNVVILLLCSYSWITSAGEPVATD